jgi:arylsulfatase A-like enzyme
MPLRRMPIFDWFRLDNALARTFVAGVTLGLYELGWLAWAIGFEGIGQNTWRMIGAAIVAGTLAVLPFGVLVMAFMRWRMNASDGDEKKGVLAKYGVLFFGALALATSAIDHTVFVNLYALAHQWLTIATVASWVLAWNWPLRQRNRPGAGNWRPLAIYAAMPFVLSPLIGDRQSVSQALRMQSGAVSWIVNNWPIEAVAAVRENCQWEPRAVSQPSGNFKGANVLLITLDAFRGDLAGESFATTMPKTDSRLNNAFRFDHAYAPAPRTTYSTYSMLTGRRANALGFVAATTDVNDRFIALSPDDPIVVDPRSWKLLHRYPLGDKTQTIARWVREQGYFSAAIVADVSLLPGAGITREFQRVDGRPYVRNDRQDLGGLTTDFTTESLLEAIEAAGERSFLIWAHYRDPHHPYLPYAPTSAQASDYERYVSEFRRVDDSLDDVFERLEKIRKLDSTIVIISGDHGEEFRDHGGLYHGTSLYQELIHVPLLIRLPQEKGRVVAEPVSLSDLAPTLVDLLGLPTSTQFHGESLAPIFDGNSLPDHRVFAYNSSYTASNEEQMAVISGDYKLIEDEKKRTIELYNLRADPRERRNLADDEPERTAHYRCWLAAARRL